MLRLLASALAGTLAVVCGQARAAEPEEAIRLTYWAPAECPGRLALEEMIRGRTHLARIVPSGDDVRLFDVHVTTERSRSVATLRARERDGRQSTRKLDASTCSEVVDGVALIIALAVDPNAKLRVAPHASPPLALPMVVPNAPALPAPRRPKERLLSWSTGASGILVGGVSPNPMPGASAFAEVRWGRGWRTIGTRLSISSGLDSEARGGHVAWFRWSAARLAVSPLRLRAGAFEASPLLWVEAGGTRVTADTGSPTGASPWVSLGAGLCARLSLGALFAELSGGVHFPQIAYHVSFERGAVKVFDVPSVSAAGAFGLGVRFP